MSSDLNWTENGIYHEAVYDAGGIRIAFVVHKTIGGHMSKMLINNKQVSWYETEHGIEQAKRLAVKMLDKLIERLLKTKCVLDSVQITADIKQDGKFVGRMEFWDDPEANGPPSNDE